MSDRGGGDESSRNGDGDSGSGDVGSERGGSGGASGVSHTEQAVMVVSALFTLSLFAFAAWQALTAPAATTPDVRVTNPRPMAGGQVVYDVRLRNRGGVGLVSVTVEVDCTAPPIELTFENVPADGHRRGTVVCPGDATDPSAAVTSWIRE